MSTNPTLQAIRSWVDAIPVPLLVVLRGVGQVFFQENALTGALFVLGIAASSPLMAIGALVGSAIGTAMARLLKFDRAEIDAGIYGFNAALVGIATFFFFQLSLVSIVLMFVGCLVATGLTRGMRGYVPFPTYTTPFILATWGVFFSGRAAGLLSAGPGYGPLIPDLPAGFLVDSAAHGVSQVMFQASLWTALFFLVRHRRERPASCDVGAPGFDHWHGVGGISRRCRRAISGPGTAGRARPIRQYPARALRVQRHAGGRGPVSLAAIDGAPVTRHPVLGPVDRTRATTRAAGPHGPVCPGGLVSHFAWVAGRTYLR